MKKLKLPNGLTVILENRKSNVVAIEVCVHTGSNNETSEIAGMSHFLEHMVFEGTKTRTTKEISEAIENLGGEFNAATSNERTFFYVVVPKDKAKVGLDILSDIMINPIFDQKIMDKERNVVLEEIKMVNDQPSHYQWILFEKSLYTKHPTKDPVYGNVKAVSSITRKQMIDYFGKWYVPGNMTLTIVGDTRGVLPLLKSFFGSMPRRPVPKMKRVVEPLQKRPKHVTENRKINQSYVLMGYKTVNALHKDSTVLDVIQAIFSKGLSGRIVDEIRIKRGLAYSSGAYSEAKKDYGFFVFHLNTEKKNVALCKRLVLDEIRKLDSVSKVEIRDAKQFILGSELLRQEDSRKRADNLAFWEFLKSADLADKYMKDIKKVTKKDILRVRDKYFKDNYTMVRLEKK